MEISSDGLKLIKAAEGLSLSSYLCPAKVWTIGWGHTNGVRSGMVISREQADKYLRDDVRIVERALKLILERDMVSPSQCEYDAIVSLVYNIGVEAFSASSVRRLIRAHAPLKDIKEKWLVWNKIKQKGQYVVSKGLANRRNNEWNLYMSDKLQEDSDDR